MTYQININEDIYKKFQAALMLTGEDEETVIGRLLSKYAHAAFERVMGKTTQETKAAPVASVSDVAQKQAFVNWFRTLTRNGKPYNPVTISGYTGRIENACADPVFATVPVDNLFTITDLVQYVELQKQIKGCAGYAEFDAKSHNGFTAALRKYEEFLRFQATGESPRIVSSTPQHYSGISNVHRWTLEEDAICCRRFLEYYVVKQSNLDFVQFLQMLRKEVPGVSEGSLRMKVQNIKYLSIQAGLKDTANVKWLSQYSMQCERAFNQALIEMGLR